ncbi:hypothetical protein U91I_02101 [alpha proteobacterium U9-1i]|nr:hypothetical protein U91I_02101 [alpha proteobacterium U9-1i]
MRAFLIAFTLLAPGALAQEAPSACAYDMSAMMRLDLRVFDSTPDSGWRVVGETPGCEAVAADLIAAYRTQRLERERLGLLHHEAQLRAAAGQTEAALVLLEEVRASETAPEMQAYRDATIAFLRRDRAALIEARERLSRVPMPEAFAAGRARFVAAFPTQRNPEWPLNLDVVDGLVACFDRPYAEAYGRACRPLPVTR